MLKVIAASMVFVLVVSSGVFADTGNSVIGLIQTQVTTMGVDNSIDLVHGAQTAQSIQNLCVNNAQQVSGICTSQACQSLLAAINQSGDACGECALIGLAQQLAVAGNQQQAVSQGYGPASEGQALGMQAAQTLARADGAGGAGAVHAIFLNATQSGQNPATQLNEGSSVIGLQTSHVQGDAGSTSLVQSSMNVITTQTQGAV